VTTHQAISEETAWIDRLLSRLRWYFGRLRTALT